jgi:hypothetical protein
MSFFYIVQKLGDDNFFFIWGWVEMFVFDFRKCFKKIENFLFFFL